MEVSCSRCSKAREPRVACRAFDHGGSRSASGPIPKRKSTYYGRGHAWYLQVNVYTAPEKRGEVKARSIAPALAPCRPRRSCELLLV